MDGQFVPSILLGPCVIGSLKESVGSDTFFDCQLMAKKPEMWVTLMAEAGVDLFTFHIESDMPSNDPKVLIKQIKDAGMEVGVALKPKTPVSKVTPLIDLGLIDLVSVLCVEPGHKKQMFLHDMMDKVKDLRSKYPSLSIQVNGGITLRNIDAITQAGANNIVVATALSQSSEKYIVIDALRKSVETYGNGKGVIFRLKK